VWYVVIPSFADRRKEEDMKVSIDADLCTGCGACVDDVPDVFSMGDEVAEVIQPEVPEDLEEAVQEAAEGCPVEAITVE
jgi:ferredoxin